MGEPGLCCRFKRSSWSPTVPGEAKIHSVHLKESPPTHTPPVLLSRPVLCLNMGFVVHRLFRPSRCLPQVRRQHPLANATSPPQSKVAGAPAMACTCLPLWAALGLPDEKRARGSFNRMVPPPPLPFLFLAAAVAAQQPSLSAPGPSKIKAVGEEPLLPAKAGGPVGRGQCMRAAGGGAEEGGGGGGGGGGESLPLARLGTGSPCRRLRSSPGPGRLRPPRRARDMRPLQPQPSPRRRRT